MYKLKPCPFCGGEAKTEVSCIEWGGDELLLRATVYCGVCGIGKTVKFDAMCKPFENFTQQFIATAEMWNRRANENV